MLGSRKVLEIDRRDSMDVEKFCRAREKFVGGRVGPRQLFWETQTFSMGLESDPQTFFTEGGSPETRFRGGGYPQKTWFLDPPMGGYPTPPRGGIPPPPGGVSENAKKRKKTRFCLLIKDFMFGKLARIEAND